MNYKSKVSNDDDYQEEQRMISEGCPNCDGIDESISESDANITAITDLSQFALRKAS